VEGQHLWVLPHGGLNKRVFRRKRRCHFRNIGAIAFNSVDRSPAQLFPANDFS
jgi:hypothetical protein